MLYEITSTLTRLLAPILSFTSEEVWQQLEFMDKPRSVELSAFPSYRVELLDEKLSADWSALLGFRDDVNKVIETARQAKHIGKPLEARLSIVVGPDMFRLLEPRLPELPAIFLVSQVALAAGDGPTLIEATPAEGVKCNRCWLMKKDVDNVTKLCARCQSVVSSG